MNRSLILLSLAALALPGCALFRGQATVYPSSSPAAVAVPIAAVNVPPATGTGPDFLVRNGTAKGVVTTPSGLEYFIVSSGPAAGAPPAARDTVSFDYEGKLLTGETFDSSYTEGHPLVGQVDKFVPGFSEALQMMRPGDEWIVWIPPELGYGDKDVGPIPANSVLRFKLVLHSVSAAPAP